MFGDDMHIYIYRYGFPHMGGLPQYERLIIANPIKLDDLGVPPFIFWAPAYGYRWFIFINVNNGN